MAILTLREHLIVDYPGEALPLLQQLATFERIGRLRPGQHRVVRYWRLTNGGQRLILPRGLAGKAQKLLPGSVIRDERLILRPVQMGFSADLRDYQSALSDAIYQRGGGVMVMPPSAGKTHTALATVARWEQPTLFFVHQLRLHDKTLKDARKLYRLPRGGLGSIADGRTQIGTHFTVATIQTLAKKPRLIKQLAPRIGTVVIDECVVGDTLIDGRPIRDIKVGDTVWAYDETRSVWAQNPVTHVFTKPAPSYLIDVQTANQRLVCTANHPIWTQRGWVDAGRLVTGDQVLTQGDMWERVNALWVLEPDDAAYWEACPDGQVYNLEVADFHTFVANGIVTHNCHHLASTSYQKVISAFPAVYRLGLSATPDRDDGLGPMVYATLGTPIRVSREALADKGVMIDPTIYMVRTHWAPPEDVPFHAAEEERATSSERNVLVFKLVAQARARGLRVLVLVEREIHATVLAQLLSKGGVAAHPVYGRLPQPLQDRNFKAMEQGKAVVVATKLANEGLDWPALDCLVLATPGRSPTVLEQRTGRIARTAEGKTFALVYDLVDDSPMYLDQTKARIAKYQAMGYRIRRFQWPTK